jgi:D-glycero-D-manno-heptose 1,7-bisphosphate phosphatase
LPVIGLDRDGVINIDKGYIRSPLDFEPIPGSIEAIANLKQAGYKIVIITNQGGIDKGIIKKEDVDTVNERMLEFLGQAGCARIEGIYYSSSSNKKDYYAKPNIGMFKRAEAELKNIKFSKGYYVGDQMSDLKAAIKVGAKPVLVRTGFGKTTEQELEKFTYRNIKSKTMIFDDLQTFARHFSN